MKIEISPLRMMAVSGVFVFIVWSTLFSVEGFTGGSIFFALVVLVVGIGFGFLCPLTVNCWIDEEGVHRGESTISWDGVASAIVTKGLTAIVIHSPEAKLKGWIAIPAPWFVANRSEIADWIESSLGSGNRLFVIFNQNSTRANKPE